MKYSLKPSYTATSPSVGTQAPDAPVNNLWKRLKFYFFHLRGEVSALEELYSLTDTCTHGLSFSCHISSDIVLSSQWHYQAGWHSVTGWHYYVGSDTASHSNRREVRLSTIVSPLKWHIIRVGLTLFGTWIMRKLQDDTATEWHCPIQWHYGGLTALPLNVSVTWLSWQWQIISTHPSSLVVAQCYLQTGQRQIYGNPPSPSPESCLSAESWGIQLIGHVTARARDLWHCE